MMYKVCCVIVGVAFFLPLWALAQPDTDPGAAKLADLKGNSRPLLIFFPQNSRQRTIEASIQLQRSEIEAHRAELEERSVIPLYISIESSNADGHITGGRQLRNRFHVNDREFTLVLLGKDGGEKFRSHTPVTIEKLNALIDAMPMRQQEIRNGHHAN